MPNVPFSILRTDNPEVSSDRLDHPLSQARKHTAGNFISKAAMREQLRPRICARRLPPALPTGARTIRLHRPSTPAGNA
jgi:hypothetical protein